MGSWWLSSTWPENRVVKVLATHHFGLYWVRRVVEVAQSSQSGQSSFGFCTNLNKDDGCRVNHNVERFVALSSVQLPSKRTCLLKVTQQKIK